MSSRTDRASSRAHRHSATRPLRAWRTARIGVIAGCGALAVSWMGPVDAWQQAAAGTCRITGRAVSGATPLPGVSILARTGDTVKTATSTDPDGTYQFGLPAGAYEVTAELMGFTRLARSITLGAAPCDQTIDFQLTLAPRVSTTATAPVASNGSPASPAQ